MPSGNALVDEKILEAIRFVARSLLSELYIDDFTPNETNGIKVFRRERRAAEELMAVLQDAGTSDEDKAAVREAVLLLIEADRRIVDTAIQAAQTAASNAGCNDATPPTGCGQVLSKIFQAEAERALAEEDVVAENYDEAIVHLRRAWKRALRAVELAGLI